ncbi:unnamed protein product [Triticum turgidum subsp. durum]|uniref:Expansin n=1 Tax=Triticum turgidum subsp. durum TaxID=4567 RepID=A0A9R0WH10_TRITD|nr:unnamed protein product [Triticum turgidum subsp. durum]
MGKPQLALRGVAAPPVVLAVLLLLSCSLHGARAEEGESAGLDTGLAGGEPGMVNTSAVSIGQSGVARATWYGAPNGAGPYDNAPYHFDLSGTAFGKLAKPGRNDELRHAGIIDIQFTRVSCEFPGLKVGFHVEEGSNAVYMAILVEYENGDGDVVQVDLMESGRRGRGGRWTRMRESWGSIWRLDSNHRLQAPFSLRIRNESGKTLVARNVIPKNWRPNTFYRSIVQYS